MKVVGLAGWSGAGKTTLLVKLLPELARRGLAVSTVKRAHHAFDVDRPGKDSFEHRRAGAREVLVASDVRFALMHEVGEGERPPELADLLRRLAPVDLVVVEGFKRGLHPKVEVHRAANGEGFLHDAVANVRAVVTDADRTGLRLPSAHLDDVAAAADLVLAAAESLDRVLADLDEPWGGLSSRGKMV